MVMGAVASDELDGMLTRLKLTAIRDQLDTLLDEAVRREGTAPGFSSSDLCGAMHKWLFVWLQRCRKSAALQRPIYYEHAQRECRMCRLDSK